MSPENHSTDPFPFPLLKRLREHTAEAHLSLDRLVGRLDSLDAYGRYLHGMDRFLAHAARRCGASAQIDARRLLLRLDQLDRGFVPEREAESCDDARGAARCAGEALGWLYVVAGSTLGARVLLDQVIARPYGRLGQHRFLRSHACSEDWRGFLVRLRGATPDEVGQACTAALDAFGAAHAAFERPAVDAAWS